MNLQDIKTIESRVLLQTYERTPRLFVGGSGVYLRDEAGDDYLDLLSGIGVSALGYGHPAIEEAIRNQSTRLIHTSNLFYHDGTANLALRLTELSGLDRVFFCNSGTEAWEAALKLARANAGLSRSRGRHIGTKFLAIEQSFHGRTMGSVATTHKAKYREPFAPVMPEVEFVRFDDVQDLSNKFSDEVCGICIEPVQGEGGIRPVSQEMFSAARELCTSTGALLLADEIQCGFGRTGTWFAYQQYGILPDVVTLAKPIAGGIPMGAMLCTEGAAGAISAGMHGTTFGGGPLACAVALAVIETIHRYDLLRNVREVGGYFLEQLHSLTERHDAVADVRGMGLMIGLELRSAELAQTVVNKMLDRHIILNRTSERVLRFLPPYLLERRHVDIAVTALDDLLTLHSLSASSVLVGDGHDGE